jgi:hypothetical protein
MLYTLMRPTRPRRVDGFDSVRDAERCAAAWACCRTRAASTSA